MQMRFLFKSLQLVWEQGKWWMITTIITTVAGGLLPLTMLWVTKELINTVQHLISGAGEPRQAILLLVLQFLLTSVMSLLRNWQEWLDRRLEVQLDHDLQSMLSEKVTSVPVAYLDLPHFYHHLNRVQGSLGNRFLGPIKTLFDLVKTTITIVSFIGFLLTIHWGFVVLSLVSAIPVLFIQMRFGNKRFWMLLHQTPTSWEARYLSMLLIDRQGAKEIRLFGLARYLMSRWSQKYWQNAREALSLMKKQQGANVSMDAVTAFFYMGAAGMIIWLIGTATLQIGDFVAIGQAVSGLQNGWNQLSQRIASLYEQQLYIRDFFSFLEFEEPSLQRTDVQAKGVFPQPLQEGITFEDVSFSYPGSERSTLQDINLTICPGERIAIIGENGSGKSTLVKCLMGLYPVSSGQIRFDGVPIERIPEQEMYKHITVIFQDFMRYALTVRENIAFGNVERLEDADHVEAIAEQLGMVEWVRKLPQGFETNLGKILFDGEDLSGGQWQKIALARALFRNGQVMILDEPTAALDPLAERDVFRQFDRLTQNKTAIFISHRMAAARMADRIVVMQEGRIKEIGTHEELFAAQGEYYRMYQMQADWYQQEQGLEEVEEVTA